MEFPLCFLPQLKCMRCKCTGIVPGDGLPPHPGFSILYPESPRMDSEAEQKIDGWNDGWMDGWIVLSNSE